MSKALLIVDVQRDFCEEGKLAVAGGAAIAANIAKYAQKHSSEFTSIIASADWHIDPAEHFSNEPDYINTWPEHCIAYSEGAAFHDALLDAPIDIVVKKGLYSAAYSAFEALDSNNESLLALLKRLQITDLHVCGIATDHCVRATALDARSYGFETWLLNELCVGVAAASTALALNDMRNAGVKEMLHV